MSDATGTTDWGYDTLGDVVLVEGPLYPGSGGIASRWDRNSNRRLLTYTDGAVRRFDHDQAGRTVEIALAGTGGTWWPDATMSYDAVGRLLEENVLSGGEVARRTAAYNTAGKMTTYTQCWDIVGDACDDETDPATAAVYDAAIGWRHDGRVGSVCVDADDEDACSGGDDYVYDAAGQLRGSGPGCELVSGAPDGDCKETWSYDGQGHRLDHDPDTTVGSDTATYSYDDSGRLTTAVVGGLVTTSYSYDAAGRRTSVDRPGTSSDETFGYNPMGRLDQWTRNSTAIATLHSDGQGTLSAITQGPLTFPLIWDTTGAVPGLVQVASIRATWADHAISSDNGQWYGYDWLDNTNQTATSNTNPGVTLAYDPYGGIDNPQSTYLAFGFGMRASLTIGGYVHLHNRTYDPETGTFFTPDPLDTVTGTPTVGNAYHYTDNDPLNKVDPTGLRPHDEPWNQGKAWVCMVAGGQCGPPKSHAGPCSVINGSVNLAEETCSQALRLWNRRDRSAEDCGVVGGVTYGAGTCYVPPQSHRVGDLCFPPVGLDGSLVAMGPDGQCGALRVSVGCERFSNPLTDPICRHRVGLLKISGYALIPAAFAVGAASAGTGAAPILAVTSATLQVSAEAFDGSPCRSERMTISVVLSILGGAVGGAFSEGGFVVGEAVTEGGLFAADQATIQC